VPSNREPLGPWLHAAQALRSTCGIDGWGPKDLVERSPPRMEVHSHTQRDARQAGNYPNHLCLPSPSNTIACKKQGLEPREAATDPLRWRRCRFLAENPEPRQVNIDAGIRRKVASVRSRHAAVRHDAAGPKASAAVRCRRGTAGKIRTVGGGGSLASPECRWRIIGSINTFLVCT
jgi:hypothetical protein